MIKIRIRFIKRGIMMYVGHLDIMRYFQKLFRRCGFDVSYSQGFNPHQLMSFASPLGLGVTSISEYMDVSIESFIVSETCNDIVGHKLSIEEWIKRINEHSNGYIYVTGIYVLGEKTRPSMSLLSGCSYVIYNINDKIIEDIIEFYKSSDELIFTKKTKKSVKKIDIKNGIIGITDTPEGFFKALKEFAVSDVDYINSNLPVDPEQKKALYIMCISGSELNIKPEMLIGLYAAAHDITLSLADYDLERIEMYTGKDNKFISMAIDHGNS